MASYKTVMRHSRSHSSLLTISALALALVWPPGTALRAETVAPSDVQPPLQTPAVRKGSLLVVLIYDESCKTSCQVVKPIVKELTAQNQVDYEELNTSPTALKATLERARQLKIETFVSDRTEEVPVVGIFTNKNKRLKELVGFKTKEVYRDAIHKALLKVAQP
jgi:hypothetical protein